MTTQVGKVVLGFTMHNELFRKIGIWRYSQQQNKVLYYLVVLPKR